MFFVSEDRLPAACLSVLFHSLLTDQLLQMFLRSPMGLICSDLHPPVKICLLQPCPSGREKPQTEGCLPCKLLAATAPRKMKKGE